jgi:hypothetical protein
MAASPRQTRPATQLWRRAFGIIGANPKGLFGWFEQFAATRASELRERGRGGRIARKCAQRGPPSRYSGRPNGLFEFAPILCFIGRS